MSAQANSDIGRAGLLFGAGLRQGGRSFVLHPACHFGANWRRRRISSALISRRDGGLID
jgi:hypothetical protein